MFRDPRPTTADLPLEERKRVLAVRSKASRKGWRTRTKAEALKHRKGTVMLNQEPEALPNRDHNQPPLAEVLVEELAPRRASAERLLGSVESSRIIDEESAAKSVDLNRQMKELKADTDQARLARTKPLRDDVTTINRAYDAVSVRLGLAIDATNAMLTKWDNQQRAAAEAERRRLAEEARKREEEAAAARAEADAKAAAGQSSVAERLEAVRAADEAARLERQAAAIRHEPTRSQLGQTTRRKVIRFAIEDLPRRLRGIQKSSRCRQLEEAVEQITEQELRSIGVVGVEAGVDMPGVRAWVEDGGVNVRR